MKKSYISFESFCAAFQDSYLTIEEAYNELQSRQTQEEEMIRKELLSNLSGEAKFIVRLVLSSPLEVLEALSPPNYKRPTRNSLRRHLAALGFTNKTIDFAFDELKAYTKELNFRT